MSQEKEKQNIEKSLRLAKESEGGSRIFSGKIGFFVRWFAIIIDRKSVV